MKLLTFLGATQLGETTYRLSSEQTHRATACGIAIARFFPDLSARVFVTKGAHDANYKAFADQIQDYVADLEAVLIADGSDESQMWEIFQKVVDHVDQGEEVIFDITHGFRSLPFIAFLAAAYLREVKQARIHKVFYGNYEARDRSVVPNVTSVIDLTRFVSLLDWMKAVSRFNQSGDSRDMATLLEEPTPSLESAIAEDTRRDRANIRKRTVSNLRSLSLALQLNRADDAMAKSAELEQTLAHALAQDDLLDAAFGPLVQQVADTYQPIAFANPAADPVGALAQERTLVFWLLERGQYMQAAAIAREWMVTWTMLWCNETMLLNKTLREQYGRSISARSPLYRNEVQDSTVHDLSAIPSIDLVATAFQQLGDLRNSMMHAWKRPSAMRATKAETNLEQYCQLLAQLPLPPHTGNQTP